MGSLESDFDTSGTIPRGDLLRDVFPEQVRDDWRAHLNPELLRRLTILNASGPYPEDAEAIEDIRHLRARRAGWETYIHAAFARGMFEGERGRDLRGRFVSRNPHDFRSALSECMACWFLAGRMRLPLKAVASGRARKNLDMRVLLACGETGVEVKAPHTECPPSGGWSGGESSKIRQAIESANKQLDDDRPNILVLAPRLRVPMFSERDHLLRAAYGYTQLVAPFNADTGEAGPMTMEFEPGGKFLNNRRPGGKLLKPDGMPSCRRISAVVCVEERFAHRLPSPASLHLRTEEVRADFWDAFWAASQLHYSSENDTWIEHNVLVLHNPWAYHPLPLDVWRQFAQLVPDGHTMKWTDGEDVVL